MSNENGTSNTDAKNEARPNKKRPKKLELIPRGKPKSGRIWKNPKIKFSSIIKTKGIKDRFEKRRALKQELQRLREAMQVLKEAKEREVELRKERRRENLRRQEENRKKSEIVQVITNSSKLKRMKRKQLRHIEKRDTN